MRKLYDLLHAPMTLPKPFGKFHLLVLLVIFSLTIIFTIILIKSKHKNIWVFSILLIGWILLVILEILKQIYTGLHLKPDKKNWYWDYNASHNLPVFLCSMPLYFIPLYLIIRNKQVKQIILNFLTIFSLYAGGIVLLAYPNWVFDNIIFLNLNTTIFHGYMLFIGMIFIFSGIVKFHIKSFLWAFLIFIFVWMLVGLGNEIIYQIGLRHKLKITPNLFTISHRQETRFTDTILSLTKGKLKLSSKAIYFIYPFATFIFSGTFFLVFGLIGFTIQKILILNNYLYKERLVKKSYMRRKNVIAN